MGRRIGQKLAISLALLAVGTTAEAQQAAVVEFNRDVGNVWDTMRPSLQRMIYDQVQTQLGSLNQTSRRMQISVRNLRHVGFSIQNPPGLTALGADRVGLRVPLAGTWGFEIEAEVRVKMNLWFLRPTIDIPVRLIIEDLSAEITATFDVSDPTRPTMAQVGRPVVDFKVKLRSRNWLWNVLFRLLSPVGNYFAHKVVKDALDDIMPTLAGLSGFPGPVPAAGAPTYTDSGQAMPFREIVDNVDRKIRRDHTPHGPILGAYLDTDSLTSWEEAYRAGGSGTGGSVVNYPSGGDSAIWTGHYLASQALRYAGTNGDPAALDTVKHALGGIGKLLDVNGSTGLLARNAAPLNSIVGQNIQRHGQIFRRRVINGETWVCRQGSNGISRDQNSGVMFGLALTYDLVNDASVKAEASARTQMLLDYFVSNDWIIDEDRPTVDLGSRGPTFWLGIPSQKLAFLLTGMRMSPGKYDAEFQRAAPIVYFNWIAAWTATFGFDHYYKYNLAHSAYFTYFRYEADQTRWQEMNRGYRIMERYVGHHRNAHFDLVQTSINPSTSAVLHPATRESMRRFLRRRHREIVPAVVDLSNVVWQTFTFSAYSNPSSGGASFGSTTTQVPSEPLDFHQRRYTGDFHWQRDPFTPGIPNQGNPKLEKNGLDVVLPYWMGKHLGAF